MAGASPSNSVGGSTRPARRERTNIGIGIVTLLAIGAASATGLFLPGLLRGALPVYTIVVPAGEDISGVRRETPVLMGGLPRGRVLSITDQSEDGRASFRIEFELEPDPPMTSNLRAEIVRSPVSNTSTINFVPVADSNRSAALVPPNSEVNVNAEPSDAALFMTPAAQKAFEETWKNIELAQAEWPPMIEHARSRAQLLVDDARKVRAEFDATFSGNAARVEALIQRFRAIGDELTAARDDWNAMRGSFDGIANDLSERGIVASMRRQFAMLGERLGVAGIDGTSMGTTADGFARRWEDLKTSASHLVTTLAGWRGDFDSRSTRADFSIAATELFALSTHIVRTALGIVFPNRTAESEARDRADELSRQLLFGIEQARAAERALRAIQEGVDEVPTGLLDLERLIESLRRLTELEDAMFERRVGPERPAP